jgi:MFS family permease
MCAFTRFFGEDAVVLRDRNYQILLLTTVMAPLGTGLLSPILDSLTGVYGVSPSRIGLMMASLTAPGIMMIPLMGVLADSYGRKNVLVLGTLLFGISGGAIALTTEFRVILGLRFLQGVGFSGIVPTLITSIGDIFDDAEETTAQGIRLTVVGFSQVVFPFLAGTLVIFAWQYPFLLYTMAIPIALILAVWLEEPSAVGKTKSNKGPGDSGQVSGSTVRELVEFMANRRAGAILIGRSLPTFVWIGFITYNSIVVSNLLKGTPQEAGIIIAASSLTFAAGASQAGRVTSFFSSRFVPLITTYIGMAAGFSLFAFAQSLPVAGLGVIAGGFGFGMSSSLYRSIITGLGPTQVRGGLVSIAEALGRIAATLAPVLMGIMISVWTPIFGFELAIRWTMCAIVVGPSALGVASLILAKAAAPLPS